MFYDSFAIRKRTKFGSFLVQKAIEKWVKVALESSPIKILEIGVGRRQFYEQLKKENPQMEYTGIEASDTLYEEAKNNGINVIKCFVPPFPQELMRESFDLVVMIHVLEHFRDFREATEVMKGINDLLKPKGRLLLICPCARDNGIEFFDCDYTHSYITTENRINMLLQDTGFKAVKWDSYRACFNNFKWFFYIASRIVNFLAFFLRYGSYRSIKVKMTLSKNLMVVAEKPVHFSFESLAI